MRTPPQHTYLFSPPSTPNVYDAPLSLLVAIAVLMVGTSSLFVRSSLQMIVGHLVALGAA